MESRFSPRPIGHMQFNDLNLIISVGTYVDNNRLAVMLHGEDGLPYSVVSKNIPSLDIDGDQFFVNWYNMSPGLLQALDDCGFFEDTGRRIRPDGSFVELPLWQMKDTITAGYVTAHEE